MKLPLSTCARDVRSSTEIESRELSQHVRSRGACARSSRRHALRPAPLDEESDPRCCGGLRYRPVPWRQANRSWDTLFFSLSLSLFSCSFFFLCQSRRLLRISRLVGRYTGPIQRVTRVQNKHERTNERTNEGTNERASERAMGAKEMEEAEL